MDSSSSSPEPIAIVGMGCRLPGGADSPDKFWQLISEGQSAWTDVPPERWNWNSFYHPHSDTQEGHNQRGGHFIEQDLAAFDAGFFGVAPNEAKTMDPQQRILLETTYEALENAGIPLESIRGSDTGVYVATFSQDWETMQLKDTTNLGKYHVTGTHKAIVANRISYLFDLKGPSFSLDTACSGGLVAMHQACQALRMRESRLALVGGTNLIMAPEYMFGMSFLNMLNSDGKSYSFDERGSGYGRGEGVATLVLKRLDDALADGDPIRAVIRHTGINQDGKTNGITYPSAESQEMLSRLVYQQAGLDPKDTTYIEAHGTGTIAGDKIELGAISNVFCVPDRAADLVVGSVKANMGHLECTSGLAAIIKSVLALEKGEIPAVPSLVTLKESLRDIVSKGITIPTSLMDWPENTPLRASVQNFGFGGTNAHVILDAAGGANKALTNGHHETEEPEEDDTPRLFVFSARAKDVLRSSTEEIQSWLDWNKDELKIDDLAHTFASRRSQMSWRSSCVASDAAELISGLQDLPATRSARRAPVVFLFTGQGAQWFAMGRELLQLKSESGGSVFRDSIARSDAILQSLGLTWGLVDELLKDKKASSIDKSEVAQPASTAVQVALVDLLRAFGLEPEAVVGHSSGEIAAAYAAGGLTQEEALTVSLRRSQISQWCREIVPKQGAMMAAGLGEEEMKPYIKQVKAESGIASVACINSPVSTTLTGDKEAVEELQQILQDASVFNRLLKVDTAYHSHHMQTVAPKYLEALGDIPGSSLDGKTVRFFSSVTTEEKTDGFGSEYWVKNLVSQVRFSQALETLCLALRRDNEGPISPFFIEIGPHAALKGPFGQTLKPLGLPDFEYQYTSALSRGQDARLTVLTAIGKAFEIGCSVDVEAANALGLPKKKAGVVKDLPPYPWDRSNKYWHESRLSTEHRQRLHPYHDLLGLRQVSGNSVDPTWRHILAVDRLPWLRDHVIDDFMIFPGSGYVCMAVEATRQLAEDAGTSDSIRRIRVRDVRFIKALIIPESPELVEAQLILRQGTGGWREFLVVALADDGHWAEHCRGFITAEQEEAQNEIEGAREVEFAAASRAEWLGQARESCTQALDHDTIYADLKKNGNYYGPTFADITELKLGGREAVAAIGVPDIQGQMPGQFMQRHLIHPSTLDAITQVLLPLHAQHNKKGSVMPISIGEIVISSSLPNQPGDVLDATVHLGAESAKVVVLSAGQADLSSEPVLSMTSLKTITVGEGEVSDEREGAEAAVLDIEWETAADFYAGSNSEPAPLTGMEVENQIILDKAAALFIKGLVEGEEFAPKETQKQFYDWVKSYGGSGASEALLLDTPADAILSRAQSLGVTGELLSKIGQNLRGILSGSEDAGLAEGDQLSRVEDALDSLRLAQEHAAQYLYRYSVKKRTIKILEVNAGSGNATKKMLDALRSRTISTYDSTDKSPEALDKAKDRLGDVHAPVEFKVLDISTDPVAQGFSANSYDVVIVNSPLHAAKALKDVVGNARKLLVSGGALITTGASALSPAYTLLFGATGSVWSGQQSTKLPSTEEWTQLLSQNSFSDLEPATKTFARAGQTFYCNVSTAITPEEGSKLPIKVCTTSDLLKDKAATLSSLLSSTGASSTAADFPKDSADPESVYVILEEASTPFLADMSSSQLQQLKALILKGKNILWVSMRSDGLNHASEADMNMIDGFARTVRKEHEGLKIITMLVTQDISDSYAAVFDAVKQIVKISFQEKREELCELNYEYRNDRVLVPRIRPASKYQRWRHGRSKVAFTEPTEFLDAQRSLVLEVETPGLLSSLRFTEAAPQKELGAQEIEVEPRAYGVNSKDVDIALGHADEQTKATQVSEWAGVVTAAGSDLQDTWKVGDRVCGIDGAAPFANRRRVSSSEVIRKLPESMSFTDAASVPFAFSTAYRALVSISGLRSGQSVLVHAAEDAVGQAAVMIAQMVGAQVFATVGSTAGSKLLAEDFHLPESHVFSSKSATFEQGIMRQTADRGVDVVLNALGEAQFAASWACVAQFGNFINIANASTKDLVLPAVGKNVVFTSLDLGLLVHHRPDMVGEIMDKILSHLEDKSLHSLGATTVKSISDIEDAFRLVSKHQTPGKVVLQVEKGHQVKAVAPEPPKLELSGDASYVVAGGLGGFGLQVCTLLVNHGARHIVALSRSGASKQSQGRDELEKHFASVGAKLYLPACDITNAANVDEVAKWCADNIPLVRGVIQSAAVALDGVFESIEAEPFNVSVRSKRAGTVNLDNSFASDHLDFFLMLSSAASILGSKGQTPYSTGNSFEAGYATQRKATGTKTEYIALMPGLIAGTEFDRSAEQRNALYRQGNITVDVEYVLDMVEYAVGPQGAKDGYPHLALGVTADPLPHDGTYNIHYFTDILSIESADKDNADGPASLEQKIAAASSNPEELRQLLAETIKDKIGELVAINADDLRTNVPIAELGLDSLVAIEVKNWIVRAFDAQIQTAQVADASSIVSLADLVMSKSGLINGDKSASAGSKKQSTNASTAANGAAQQAEPEAEAPQTNGHPLHGFDCCSESRELNVQPLANLGSLLDLYLEAVAPLLDAEQLSHMEGLLDKFKQPGSMGETLHSRLAERANDPDSDNWLFRPYVESVYTGRNDSVLSNISAASHVLGEAAHSQAERAAVVSLAALQFKQKLDAGALEPAVLADRAQCMYLREWLFNAFREPIAGTDEMQKLLSDDYVAVFRRGHLFRVDLVDSSWEPVSFETLRATFQAILDKTQEDDSWVGILTADERDSWAETRQLAKEVSADNETFFETIEGAAFVVSLDDSEPSNARERMESLLSANGLNRWFDKGLTFVVSSNGVSGSVIERSMVDESTARELTDGISAAIINRQSADAAGSEAGEIELQELPFQSSPEIDQRIAQAKERYLQNASTTGFTTWTSEDFGRDYLDSLGLPEEGVLEALVQLAFRYFSEGKAGSSPSWSEVAMGHYHKGRPELAQTHTAQMKAFCDAAAAGDDVSTSEEELRELLVDAAERHLTNVMRVQDGEAYERTLSAMPTLLREGEELPELYGDDLYVSLRGRGLATGAAVDSERPGADEVARMLHDPEAAWVQYGLDAERARLSIVAAREQTARFAECLDKAAAKIRELLDLV